MSCYIPGCLGNYDFERIVDIAIKRFVEGRGTIALMKQARSEREKEEIAVVSLLDVEDDQIRDLHLCCRHNAQCKIMDCRERLRKMIDAELSIRESVCMPARLVPQAGA